MDAEEPQAVGDLHESQAGSEAVSEDVSPHSDPWAIARRMRRAGDIAGLISMLTTPDNDGNDDQETAMYELMRCEHAAVDSVLGVLTDPSHAPWVRVRAGAILVTWQEPRAFPLLFELALHQRAAPLTLRQAAVWDLRKLYSTAAVPALAAILFDRSEELALRASAAHELGCIRAAESLGMLIVALGNADELVRRMAVSAIGYMRAWEGSIEAAVPTLVERLSDSEAQTREIVASVLGASRDPRAVAALCEVAARKREPSSVRRAAIIALGDSGDRHAVPVLLRLINGKLTRFHGCVVVALGKIRDMQAIGRLLEIANDDHVGDDLRLWAAEAAAEIGSEEAVRLLIRRLDDPDLDNTSKGNIVLQLAELGEGSVVATLIAFLDNEDDELASDAARALSRLRATQAVQPLVRLLQHSNTVVRYEAALALGEIGSVDAADALRAALADSDYWVVDQAVEALGKVRPAWAFDVLISLLLNRKVAGHQWAAVSGLVHLGDRRAVPHLLNAARDDDEVSKWHYTLACALSELGDASVVPALYELWKEFKYEGDDWDAEMEASIAALETRSGKPEAEGST